MNHDKRKYKRWIIGIDEVGRGPLAGPLTVAAVVAPVISNFQFPRLRTASDGQAISKQIPKFKYFKDIKDSKKLSPAKREEWDKKIRDRYQIAIASVGPAVIDRIGISKAARIAVARCLKKITKRYTLNAIRSAIVLDGGLFAPKTYLHQETIIKGDERHPVIAAASIVAKVHRDRLMRRIAQKFPLYFFHRHKGYGTKAHQAAIKRHGLSPVHRRSFCGKITIW